MILLRMYLHLLHTYILFFYLRAWTFCLTQSSWFQGVHWLRGRRHRKGTVAESELRGVGTRHQSEQTRRHDSADGLHAFAVHGYHDVVDWRRARRDGAAGVIGVRDVGAPRR